MRNDADGVKWFSAEGFLELPATLPADSEVMLNDAGSLYKQRHDGAYSRFVDFITDIDLAKNTKPC